MATMNDTKIDESLIQIGIQEPTLVEFTLLDPSLKTKSKQIAYTIFTHLNINDDHDLIQMNYFTDRLTKLVHKIAARFKEKDGKI
jgi:hypothetical protein